MIISSGQVLEIELVVFEDRGDRYQCVLETQYGSISSDLVEIIGEIYTDFCTLICVHGLIFASI